MASRAMWGLLAGVVVARVFVFGQFIVESGSMKPTLGVGDYVVVNKLAYGIRLPFVDRYLLRWSEPKPGDVVVFTSPVDGRDYVKRVVGIPGQRVALHNNALLVDDAHVPTTDRGEHPNWHGAGRVLPLEQLMVTHVEESLADARWTTQRWDEDVDWTPEPVPPAHVLVLGDNRDDSIDSRAFGPVGTGRIKGRLGWVWWAADQ